MTRPLALAALLTALTAGTARAAEPAPRPPAAAAPATRPPHDWPTLRWGMTEAEVLAALPGQAQRLEPPERLADGRVVSVGFEPQAVEGVPFRVRFVFEAGRLVILSLKSLPGRPADGADYDRLRARFTERLHDAGTERRDATATDYRHARWDLPGEHLDLKFIPGTLVLQQSPAR
jgi:hypothetical protein